MDFVVSIVSHRNPLPASVFTTLRIGGQEEQKSGSLLVERIGNWPDDLQKWLEVSIQLLSEGCHDRGQESTEKTIEQSQEASEQQTVLCAI